MNIMPEHAEKFIRTSTSFTCQPQAKSLKAKSRRRRKNKTDTDKILSFFVSGWEYYTLRYNSVTRDISI